MDKDAITAFLRENLQVSIAIERVSWSDDRTVRIKLVLDGETLSEDTADLYSEKPVGDTYWS